LIVLAAVNERPQKAGLQMPPEALVLATFLRNLQNFFGQAHF
jgi:hypothetical protein